MKSKVKRNLLIGIPTICLLVFIVIIMLIYNGVILLNGLSASRYQVRGVDVSSYQGEIDWETLADQDIQFAFIKATEGSSFVDPYFAENYSESKKTDLRIGAYHFFSYDSSGKTQAENFISTVEPLENMLPPVVDVEFYDDKETNLPNKKDVYRELKIFIDELEKHYGLKPIIYATEKSYELFIADSFNEYDIWIRNVITQPSLSDNRNWTFWQYTNRDRLKGYSGKEKYIDVNVFYGDTEKFNKYPVK